MELLKNVRSACKERGISVAELERRAGLSHSTIARWDRNAPSIDKVISVADFFGVSVDDLIGRSEPALSKSERMLLELLGQLNEDGQGAAFAMLQGLTQQPGYIKKSDYDREVEEVR